MLPSDSRAGAVSSDTKVACPFVGQFDAEPAIPGPEVAIPDIAVVRFGVSEESQVSIGERFGVNVLLAAVPAVSQALVAVFRMGSVYAK